MSILASLAVEHACQEVLDKMRELEKDPNRLDGEFLEFYMNLEAFIEEMRKTAEAGYY